MCQIIYKAEEKPFDFEQIIKYISQAIQYNRDGWGIAHNKIREDGTTEYIKLIRGVTPHLEYIVRTIKALDIRDRDELAIHLRMATHGVISLGNCHPLLIGTEQTEWQEYVNITYPVMFHNGVLPGYSTLDKKSDSCQMAEKISKDIYKDGQLIQFITDDNFRNKILQPLKKDVDFNKFLFILPKINKAIKSILLGKWNTYGDIMTSSYTSTLTVNSPTESKKTGIISNNHTYVNGFQKRKPAKPMMKESIFSMDIDKTMLKEIIKNLPVSKWNKGDVFVSDSTSTSFWHGLCEISHVYENGNYSIKSIGGTYEIYNIKDDDDLKGCKKVELKNYQEIYDTIEKNKEEFDILKEKVMNVISSKNFKSKLKVSGVGKVPMITVWYALLMLGDKMSYREYSHPWY